MMLHICVGPLNHLGYRTRFPQPGTGNNHTTGDLHYSVHIANSFDYIILLKKAALQASCAKQRQQQGRDPRDCERDGHGNKEHAL